MERRASGGCLEEAVPAGQRPASAAAIASPTAVNLGFAPMNQLYYGDNLDVLRRYVADESVDLVYLDPPFKSDQSEGQARQAGKDFWRRSVLVSSYSRCHLPFKSRILV